jgi:hypothetical protein
MQSAQFTLVGMERWEARKVVQPTQRGATVRKKTQFRPSLELLENRWVPATVQFFSGVLSISNQNTSPASTGLLLTQTAANTFKVTDNGSSNGT